MSAQRTVIGIVLIVAIAIGGLWWRATWVGNHLLHVEAAKAIAEKSGGVYRIEVGRARYHLLRRYISVDSIYVTTNEEANAQRPRPRTALRLKFHQCTIAGMHLFTLIAGRGLIAETFGCADVSASAKVPRRPPRSDADTVAPPPGARQAFFVLQQGLRLPKFAPRVQVARIDFPHVELDLRLQRARGGEARLELEHLQWRMTDLSVDPADSVATARPLFSRRVELSAANFVAHPDSNTAARIEGFVGSLSDSALEIGRAHV